MAWNIATHAPTLAEIAALLVADKPRDAFAFFVLTGCRALHRRLTFSPAAVLRVPGEGTPAPGVPRNHLAWLHGTNLVELRLADRTFGNCHKDAVWLAPPPDFCLPRLRRLTVGKNWLLELVPASVRDSSPDAAAFPACSAIHLDEAEFRAYHRSYERGLCDAFPVLEALAVESEGMADAHSRPPSPLEPEMVVTMRRKLRHDVRQFEALNWIRATCPVSLTHLHLCAPLYAAYVLLLARLVTWPQPYNRLLTQLHSFSLGHVEAVVDEQDRFGAGMSGFTSVVYDGIVHLLLAGHTIAATVPLGLSASSTSLGNEDETPQPANIPPVKHKRRSTRARRERALPRLPSGRLDLSGIRDAYVARRLEGPYSERDEEELHEVYRHLARETLTHPTAAERQVLAHPLLATLPLLFAEQEVFWCWPKATTADAKPRARRRRCASCVCARTWQASSSTGCA